MTTRESVPVFKPFIYKNGVLVQEQGFSDAFLNLGMEWPGWRKPMATKVDLTDYIIDQTMHVYVSKEAVNKFSYDEIIKSLQPKGNWSLTSFNSHGNEEVGLTYRNDDGIREPY